MFLYFFFNDTATTEIYTLSLHDALPISGARKSRKKGHLAGLAFSLPTPGLAKDTDPILVGELSERLLVVTAVTERRHELREARDRKSTRLNSSHANISYAVFCLKKKNNI